MKITIFIIILMSINPILCYAGESGSAGVAFLKIPVGARSVSMGEAHGAIEGDIESIYYNPAGIARMPGLEATFMHDARWLGMRYEYIAFATPIGLEKGIGMSISYFSAGKLEGMDVNGTPTEDFSAYDLNFSLSYAMEIKNGLCVGLSLKAIAEKIEKEGGSSLAFDLGGMYKTTIRGLTIGMSLQNIGKGIELVRKSYPLPLNLKLASSYKFPGRPMRFCVDLNIPNDDMANLCLGSEYRISRNFAVRSGYKAGSDLGVISGLRIGCGFEWDRFSLDYGYSPYGVLGNSHKISISLRQ